MPILPSSSPVRAKQLRGLALLLVFAAALFCLSLTIGSTHIGLESLLSIIGGRDRSSTAFLIVRHVRFARSVGALLCGMALALAGALLQKVLHNSLAGPSIIGVNSAAGLFALLGSLLFPTMIAMSSLFAFFGALASSILVYTLAKRAGSTHLTIILAGVAVSSLLGSCTDALLTFRPDTQMGRLDFLIGSFAHLTSVQIAQIAPYIGLGILLTLFLHHDIGILALGDETAHSLGVAVGRTRFLALMVASLLSASAISICGLIGFVGLVVPHMVRYILSEDSPLFLAYTALMGALITLGCDLLARTLFSPYELPVGILLSALGSPFFLFLLFRRRARRA